MLTVFLILSSLFVSSYATIDTSNSSSILLNYGASSTVFFSSIEISPSGRFAAVIAYPALGAASVLSLIDLANFTSNSSISFACDPASGVMEFTNDAVIWVACSSLGDETFFYQVLIDQYGSLSLAGAYKQPVGAFIGEGIPNSNGQFYAVGGTDDYAEIFYVLSPASVNPIFDVSTILATEKYAITGWTFSTSTSVLMTIAEPSELEHLFLIDFSGTLSDTGITAPIIELIDSDKPDSPTEGYAIFSNGTYGSWTFQRWNWQTVSPISGEAQLPFSGPPLYTAITDQYYFVVSLNTIGGPCSTAPGRYNTITQMSKSNLLDMSVICFEVDFGAYLMQWDTPIAADANWIYIAQANQFIRYAL